jgi:hypothetical protein
MNPVGNNIPNAMRFNSATNVNIYNNLPGNNNIYNNNNVNSSNSLNKNINYLANGATFIFTSIGNRTIINEDFNTFQNNLKSNEWTNNSLYKLAINVPIYPTFNTKKSKDGGLDIHLQNNFNNYLLNLPSYLDDFNSYVNEINNRNMKMNEDIEKNKNNFISQNLPKENPNMDFNLLLNKISQNKSYILSKDHNLYSKISNLLPLLKDNKNNQPSQPQQVNNNNLASPPPITEQKLPQPQQPNIPNNQMYQLPYQQNQNNIYNNVSQPQNIYQNSNQQNIYQQNTIYQNNPQNNNNYGMNPNSLYNNVGTNNIYNQQPQQPNTIYNQGVNNNTYVPNNMFKKF